MSDSATSTKQTAFAGTRYTDAHAAIAFLERAFGFERQLVIDGENGTVAHAQLRTRPGGSIIMMGSGRSDDAFGYRTPAEAGGVTMGLYIIVDDIDAHCERARAAGAEIVEEVKATDYGSRDFAARDPEGHLWHFGTYDPTAIA